MEHGPEAVDQRSDGSFAEIFHSLILLPHSLLIAMWRGIKFTLTLKFILVCAVLFIVNHWRSLPKVRHQFGYSPKTAKFSWRNRLIFRSGIYIFVFQKK